MRYIRENLIQISIFLMLAFYLTAGTLLIMLFGNPNNVATWIQVGFAFVFLLSFGYVILLCFLRTIQVNKASYDSLRAFTKFLPDRVVILNAEGRFVDIINRYHSTGIYHADDVIGKTVHEAYTREFADFCMKEIRQTLALNKARIIEYSNVNPERVLVHYEGRIVPYTDSNTGERRVIWTSRDITERINAEKFRLDLAVERNKVQFLNEFLSNMTHDFKTPLAIINTNAYIVGKTEDEVQRKTRLERIQEEVKKLTQMVDDMLESARLEGEVSGSFVDIALQPMIKEIVHELQAKAEQKSLSLEIKLDLPSEQLVRAIPRELSRAISNLVDNALKYTPASGVVHVRLFRKAGTAIIEVQDSGIGIDEADFDKIFTRFFRTDSGRFHTSGTGLGLAIVKMIIERHSGEIEVESEPGKGSTFRVMLPLIANEAKNAMTRSAG